MQSRFHSQPDPQTDSQAGPETGHRLPLNPLQAGLLMLGLACAWGGIAWGSFQYDDFANILNDSATTDLAALADRLSGSIRPLTRLSYAICAQLLGEWAGGWLLVQLFVHALTVLGVARLAQLRTGNTTAAVIAAACFAFPPSHAAIIAYASGRSTGFATALLIGALLSHELAGRSGRTRLYTALAILLFLLACAAKEIAIVFPALVLLWEATHAPASSRAWTNLGMAHFAANHYAPAQRAFRTALALDPANTRVMFNLELVAALNTHPSE